MAVFLGQGGVVLLTKSSLAQLDEPLVEFLAFRCLVLLRDTVHVLQLNRV